MSSAASLYATPLTGSGRSGKTAARSTEESSRHSLGIILLEAGTPFIDPVFAVKSCVLTLRQSDASSRACNS